MPRDSHNRRGLGRGGRMTDDIEDYPPVQCNNCGHCMTSSISRSQAQENKRLGIICPICKNIFRLAEDRVVSREAFQEYNNSPAGLSRSSYLKCSDCAHTWRSRAYARLEKRRRFDGCRCPRCRGRNTSSPTSLKELEEWRKDILDREDQERRGTLERMRLERAAREEAREEARRAAREEASRIIGSSSVCTLLKSHSAILRDDPERLSTDFLKDLIGPKAGDC